MHIERCDIEGCIHERPTTNPAEIPSPRTALGGDPGWRYVEEFVLVPVPLPSEIQDMATIPLLKDMISQMAERVGSLPKRVARLVCPNHDGMSWPLKWKAPMGVATVEDKAYDGIPRDADGNVIEVG